MDVFRRWSGNRDETNGAIGHPLAPSSLFGIVVVCGRLDKPGIPAGRKTVSHIVGLDLGGYRVSTMSSATDPSSALLPPDVLARAARLVERTSAVVERSRDLVWWGGRLCRDAGLRLRPIAGGATDSSLILGVLGHASRCAACIARMTGIPASHVEAVLRVIAHTFSVRSAVAPCDDCLKAERVFWLP